MMLRWLRRRQEARRLSQADGRSSGTAAPRSVVRLGSGSSDVILTDGTTHAGRTPVHRRSVALIVARMTGKRVGVDTATRMLDR
jgi:hypothetical protein